MNDSTEPTPPGTPSGARPPASSTPGMIPGAHPPATPGSGGYGVPLDRTGLPVEAPVGLSKALIGVTAAFTLVQVALAFFAQGDVDRMRQALETGDLALSPSMFVSFLTVPLLVMAYIAYGMWMSRMRRNREALGTRPGLPAVEWWGWFVPIASLVLVPLGARRVTGRAVSLGVLLGWWITWVVAQSLSSGASVAINASIDLRTGDLVRPELLDVHAPLVWAAAALTVVSWGLLYSFIRQATARHLQA